MNKAALLKKIRTLAERGVGGEAENAEKLLAHMMERNWRHEARFPILLKCARAFCMPVCWRHCLQNQARRLHK